jgi:hypothetical protein
MEPLVSMRGITKFIYGGDGRPLRNTEVKILDEVDFDVFPGEVHVLVGENGAGKSTLMKILGGIIPPDRGELRIAGETATPANARDVRENGLAFIHQELNLCANLDVAHNIFWAANPVGAGSRMPRKCTVAAPNCSRPWLRIWIRACPYPGFPPPSSNWWRSPRRCPSSRGSSSWMNPQPASPNGRSTCCSI